jgi:hypothetical protein
MNCNEGKYVKKKKLLDGVLLGRAMYPSGSGAFGYIYDVVDTIEDRPSHSHLLVKQLAYENDNGKELVKEYRIARFLEMNVPSFVAGPFGLMRGVARPDAKHEEKLSFMQQPIRGKTFDSIGDREFTTLQLCSMFLQCNEFYLRVGGSLIMEDVNTGNVMVTWTTGAPRVKFIDFGCWLDKDSTNRITDSSSYDVMMGNIYYRGNPMLKLMLLMGFDMKEFLSLYREIMDNRAPILALPAKITSLFERIPSFDWQVWEIMSELGVVQELCELRYKEKNAGRPLGVISEFMLRSNA